MLDDKGFPKPAFLRRVLLYRVLEAENAVKDAVQRIEHLPDAARRRDCQHRLQRLREELWHMDLSGLGWPPRQGQNEMEDILHADRQKLVSAVVRFDHQRREAQILYYTLKEKP